MMAGACFPSKSFLDQHKGAVMKQSSQGRSRPRRPSFDDSRKGQSTSREQPGERQSRQSSGGESQRDERNPGMEGRSSANRVPTSSGTLMSSVARVKCSANRTPDPSNRPAAASALSAAARGKAWKMSTNGSNRNDQVVQQTCRIAATTRREARSAERMGRGGSRRIDHSGWSLRSFAR